MQLIEDLKTEATDLVAGVERVLPVQSGEAVGVEVDVDLGGGASHSPRLLEGPLPHEADRDPAIGAVTAGGGTNHDRLHQDLPGLGVASSTLTPVARLAIRVHPAAWNQCYFLSKNALKHPEFLQP